MKVRDARLPLTHEEQVFRAMMVSSGQGTAKEWGTNGYSCVPRILQYVDYNNIWIIPTFHSLLLGVCKGFLEHIFRKNLPDPAPLDAVTYQQRKVISGRASHYRVLTDYGRRYRDVIAYRYALQACATY